MVITKKALSRRTFVCGAGVVFAVPFLNAMVPALSAMPRPRARRLGFFYAANGQNMVEWMPGGEGHQLEFGSTMKGLLEAFRSKVVVVTGLMNRGGESTGDGGGTHTRCQAAWLSGVKAKQTDIDPVLGKTADQYAAEVWASETPLPSLELSLEDTGGGKTCDHGYSCAYRNPSWRTASTPNPVEVNPRRVFERLFGDGGTVSERRIRLEQDASVLDRVTDQIAHLTGTLGSSDRAILGSYFDDIREIERRIQRAEMQAADVPLPFDRPLSIPESYDEYASLMYDLLAVAYQADITRVATFQICQEISGRAYPQLGILDGHHSLSHHQNDPDRLRQLAKLNTFHLSFFARFLEKLDNMSEGDGTALDNSLLAYGSGMSDSDAHDPSNVPLVLVGGAGGALKGGRAVRYDPNKATPLANAWVTALALSDIDVHQIGDSTGGLVRLVKPLAL